MTERRAWNRHEQLCALRLYCRTPFGRLHSTNPEIVNLAAHLDRTPAAVAMKACNFASLDPNFRASQRAGLGNASQSDRDLWDEFLSNPSEIANQLEVAYEKAMGASEPVGESTSSTSFGDTANEGTASGEPQADEANDAGSAAGKVPSGPSEEARLVRARRLQSFFRASVLSSYEQRCAISGLGIPELLVASHIIPWSENESRRADPRNGLCLNALYDRAFDRGLITIDADLKVRVSPRLQVATSNEFQRLALHSIDGRPLALPSRFAPDQEALRYHREDVYQAT